MLNWLKKDLNELIQNEYCEINFIKDQGIFDTKTVNLLIQKLHSNNPEDTHATVWALVVFQHWYKKEMEV